MTDLDRLGNPLLSLFSLFRLPVNSMRTSLLHNSFAVKPGKFLCCQLWRVWCLYASFYSPWPFQKLHSSSASIILFSKSFLCFILNSALKSMYGFDQASWLNSITLCTFLISIYDSMFTSGLFLPLCCIDYTLVSHIYQF